MNKILYAKPSITEREISYVNDAIRNGWGEHCYDYIYKFQDLFTEYLRVPFALTTSSCTGALHIAFAAIGIQPGDEVIVPDITWAASVVPIVYLGAKPVFVDVLRDSWCIDPEKVKKAITKKTKAILAVHLYGNLAEMDELVQIAKENNLFLIEDAAEALGSEYKNRKAGSIADFGVFSFHGTKTITSGEGGMLVTNSPELYEKARVLWDHGRNPKTNKMFWVEQIGYKYKMSNLQAALGFAQMERINELVNKKREQFYLYQHAFASIEGLTMNPEPPHTVNSFWMPTLIFDEKSGINRDDLIVFMKKNNIDIRNFFYPNSMFPMFNEVRENIVSYSIYDKGINLPSYFDMNNDIELKFVISKIKEYILKES
jgi:perosamine synthetase